MNETLFSKFVGKQTIVKAMTFERFVSLWSVRWRLSWAFRVNAFVQISHLNRTSAAM